MISAGPPCQSGRTMRPLTIRTVWSNFVGGRNRSKMIIGQGINAQVLNQVLPTLFPDKNTVIIYRSPEKEGIVHPTEQQLLAECRCDTMRGTGPGGQKRNKTESAVRVTHVATGLFAVDDVERSQHINRHHALQKLRLEFAFHLRCEPSAWKQPVPSPSSDNFAWKQPVPSPSSDNFPLWAAVALDALFATDFKLAEAVVILGTTTSQLVKHLQKLPALWQFVNAERVKRELPPLKNL